MLTVCEWEKNIEVGGVSSTHNAKNEEKRRKRRGKPLERGAVAALKLADASNVSPYHINACEGPKNCLALASK
jgi:hypothetical protein